MTHEYCARLAPRLLAALLCATACAAQAGQQPVVAICHYVYGGDAGRIVAAPVSNPYGVEAEPIGSYFAMRVVFQSAPADLASVKTYVYATAAAAPRILQQATWPYPAATRAQGPYGFSGLQFVYEPELEGELQYWCELGANKQARRKRP
ncbi:MAG: hypothetical protein KF778_15790 [Rhodocyclaceae bacterium]|nr:hypothetical protein [Rhodocyclaceae bacterium]